MKIHRLASSLQNGLTKRSSSYTILFQMRFSMTSCLNHDYLILIFIHLPYYFMKIHRLLSCLVFILYIKQIVHVSHLIFNFQRSIKLALLQKFPVYSIPIGLHMPHILLFCYIMCYACEEED